MSVNVNMKLTFDININSKKIASKITDNKQFWFRANTEWWRLISHYTPCVSGDLMEDAEITPEHILYRRPYAHRQYEGDNFDFYKEKHHLASARWDQAAKPSQLPKLIETLQKIIKSGGLKF